MRHRLHLLAFLLILAACGGGGGGNGAGGDGGADPAIALGVQLRWSAIAGAEGFVIHWGTASGDYPHALDVGMPPIENGTVGFFLDMVDESGTYVFALTAYDAAGTESRFSNEIVVVVP